MMLKTLLYWYHLRTNCIIKIYLKCLSTKTKGHSKILASKNGLTITSSTTTKESKKKIENNSKVFSLIETCPTLLKETNVNNVILNTNVCRAKSYFEIMAATRSNTDESSDYDKFQEDCLKENERLKGFRKWKDTKLGKQFDLNKANASMFTLISFNILAQNLLEMHNFIYRRNDPRALTWNHRVQKILQEIVAHDAEIICLQEVQEEHISYLTNILIPLNYKYVYKKRTYDHKDGSAIFYKTNVFTLLDFKLVEYFRPNVEVLNRDNVGIIVKLKMNDKQKEDDNAINNHIVIATTHLLYNPRRSDVRLAQTQLMLAELDKMAYVGKENGSNQYLPIILTGDFNLQPYSPVYNFLTRGIIQYSNLTFRHLEPLRDKHDQRQCNLLPSSLGISDNCQFIDVLEKRMKKYPNEDIKTETGLLLHSLNLKSSYNHFVGRKDSTASTYQDEWITVDYIFFSKGANETGDNNKIGELKLLSRLELPTVSKCNFMGPIPNLVFGSDHLILAAKFLFNR